MDDEKKREQAGKREGGEEKTSEGGCERMRERERERERKRERERTARDRQCFSCVSAANEK